MTRTKQDRQLLILGTGRSGTSYICRVLKKIGLEIGHETVLRDGTCSMYFVVPESDYTMFAHQKEPIHAGENRQDYTFQTVWHQVREPLKTIDSLAKAFNTNVRNWTAKNLGFEIPGRAWNRICSPQDKLHWAMRYYVACHESILKQKTEPFYRVEDIEQEWPRLLDSLGIDPQIKFPSNISTTTHRGLRFAFRSKEQCQQLKENMYDTTWQGLQKISKADMHAVKLLARQFGYIK